MSEFDVYLEPGKKGHLIGIGGVSMSPLAELLSGMGLIIGGTDISDNDSVKRLRTLGVAVKIGHEGRNVSPDTDFIIRTAAVHDDNPEIIAAKGLGIPVFERTQAWGSIMKDYKNALCISGTHGKTTTTSMSTHILMAARRDPTVMIGGTLPLLSAGYRVGRGDTIVMESCEYYNSFHSFFPTTAVILNIEADHLDFFAGLEDVKKSFRDFAALVPPGGAIIANFDDKNTMSALAPLRRELMTFGLSDGADVRAVNIIRSGAKTSFDILCRGGFFAAVTLRVPGLHNVKNALAACAAAICLGIDPDAVREGLDGFTGAGRRFEFKGHFKNADVYDDYAHHPGELKALFDAVEQFGYRRVIMVFQPHTFTRTKALFDDFAQQLRRADILYLAEIYAAREKNTVGISSADLAGAVDGARFFPSFDELERSLSATVSEGDIVLTVGAGDVYKIGEHLVREQ